MFAGQPTASEGYLRVSTNGGLNQMRAAVSGALSELAGTADESKSHVSVRFYDWSESFRSHILIATSTSEGKAESGNSSKSSARLSSLLFHLLLDE